MFTLNVCNFGQSFGKMLRSLFACLVIAAAVSACSSGGVPFPQAEIPLDDYDKVVIKRYGKALFELDTSDFQAGLKSIRQDFSLFLDADLDDTANVNQLYRYVTDTQLITIYQRVQEVYPRLDAFTTQLSEAMARHAFFYPDAPGPVCYTYISDLYFENAVIKRQSDIVIAIDVYLGADFPYYRYLGLPLYKIRCMTPDHMAIDVMKAVYRDLPAAAAHQQKTLLDRMIAGGKMLAYLDAVLPGVHDSLKICYTSEKLEWAKNNERNVWAFLVENELLFSTDYQVQARLIQDGPFTTGFTNSSPARLGIFIGWQIIRTYLRNHPESSLQELLSEFDAQLILNGSGYRP